MKHIKLYEEKIPESSKPSPMAFVLSIRMSGRDLLMSSTICGIYDTFYEFAEAVLEDFHPHFDDMDEEDRSEHIRDIDAVIDAIIEISEPDDIDWDFWHGFTPRPGISGYASSSNINPFEATRMLEKMLVNPEGIMLKRINTNSTENLTYIAKSIEIKPDYLSLYHDDEKTMMEILKVINWDQKKKNAMMTYIKTRSLL
jgi:hypothetical protein